RGGVVGCVAERGVTSSRFVEAPGGVGRINRQGRDVHEGDAAGGADDVAGGAGGLEAGRAEVDTRARVARKPIGGAVDGEDRHGGAGCDVTEHVAVEQALV